MDTELTKAERIAAINEMAILYKQALEYECTCYSDVDRGCKYCSLMSRADKLHADEISMKEMPDCPQIGCQCTGQPICVCGLTEKALRGWIAGKLPPMTKEQRFWCLLEIDAIEGYRQADYETASDVDLARGVLAAWLDY